MLRHIVHVNKDISRLTDKTSIGLARYEMHEHARIQNVNEELHPVSAHSAHLLHLQASVLMHKKNLQIWERHITLYQWQPISLVPVPLFPRGQLRQANWSSYTCQHSHAAI